MVLVCQMLDKLLHWRRINYVRQPSLFSGRNSGEKPGQTFLRRSVWSDTKGEGYTPF
jgi:hypothetical protein